MKDLFFGFNVLDEQRNDSFGNISHCGVFTSTAVCHPAGCCVVARLVIDQVVYDDLLGPLADGVHAADPFHLVSILLLL